MVTLPSDVRVRGWHLTRRGAVGDLERAHHVPRIRRGRHLHLQLDLVHGVRRRGRHGHSLGRHQVVLFPPQVGPSALSVEVTPRSI